MMGTKTRSFIPLPHDVSLEDLWDSYARGNVGAPSPTFYVPPRGFRDPAQHLLCGSSGVSFLGG
jgi:hypothetical protein